MESPGKNTGVGCHFLLQRIFLTQELGLLHWQVGPLPLRHWASPIHILGSLYQTALKTAKVYFLLVQEAESPNKSIGRATLPPKDLREIPSCLF